MPIIYTNEVLHEPESRVREIIDPNRTFPAITFHMYKKEVWPSHSREVIDIYDGNVSQPDVWDQPIGMCDLITNSQRNYIHFDGVEITDGQTLCGQPLETSMNSRRGQHYGLATYITSIAIAHGRGLDFISQPFFNDEGYLSQYAKYIWDSLVSKGVAEVVVPTQERWRRIKDGPMQYSGIYMARVIN